ncbi:MAG: DUF916 domain-containing protein [Chloroflexi bacterium]|nr:DUF916 domain-containing protein [Chloroflexota bacterium]
MLRLLAAVGAVLTLFVGVAGASAAEPIKLGITPVGVEGSYFTLTMSPGESRDLTVQLANAGSETVRTRTYPADAYTIINGGFGAKLDEEPTSGVTTWLSYPAATLELAARTATDRAFVVKVPADAKPGEYITSLVIQNADPVAGATEEGSGSIAFRQVIRQVIAVAITVPGPRTPALRFGGATHRTVAENSSVAVAVQNTGNVRLKPAGEFVVNEAAGKELSRVPIEMDSFYAGTETFVELPFGQRLNPGDYTASLALADEFGKVSAASGPLAFSVPWPEADTIPQPIGAGSTVAAVDQAASTPAPAASPWFVALAAGAGAMLAVMLSALGFFVWRTARRRAARPS